MRTSKLYQKIYGHFHRIYLTGMSITNLVSLYSLLILTPVVSCASCASCMYVHSISRHDETPHVILLNID
jgi:hypothetical protein